MVDFLLVTLFETFHVVGLACLVYLVLPNLKVVEAVMLTNCVCLVPGILNMFSHIYAGSMRPFLLTADALAILAQLSGLFLWAVLSWETTYENLVWIVPASLFLTSFGWWENYVDQNSKFGNLYKFYKVYDDYY